MAAGSRLECVLSEAPPRSDAIGAMLPHAPSAVTATGIAGLLGALTLLAGDLLLYAHWGTMPPVTEAVQSLVSARRAILLATPEQLRWSSVLGPIAAALYVVGAWHVFARLRRGSLRWAAVAGALFAIGAIMSGAYHAMWGQYGATLQFANTHATPPLDLLLHTTGNLQLMHRASEIVAVPLMLILLAMVALGRGDFPRWTVISNPILLFGVGTPLLTPLAADLPVPYGALLLGGLYNAAMVVFFCTSLLTVPEC